MCDLISVIVPVYKAEKYLDKCVQSIVNQTYKNLEIILVDDGSPDNCPQICDEWAKKDGRIKVIHKENGGVSSARNTALDICLGEYAAFADSDDFIEENMLESMMKTAEKAKAEVVVCGFTFEENGQEISKIPFNNKVYTNKNNELLYAYISDEIRPEACAKLIKKSVIGKTRFDLSVKYGEDQLFNYEILKKCTCLAGVENGFYHYVQNSGNSSTTAYLTEDRVKNYLITQRIVRECSNGDLYSVAVWRHIRTIFALLTRLCKCEDLNLYNSYFNALRSEILNYKKEILFGSRFSFKQRVATVILSACPKLFSKLI